MSPTKNPLGFLSKPNKPIPAGMYHYISPLDDPSNYRLHLRVEDDGDGILIINASTILHLNKTATEYAFYIVNNLPASEVAKKVVSRYEVTPEQVKEDYLSLIERIQTLIKTPDLDPVSFLDLDRKEPYQGQISAPFRLDCALTYRLPENQSATFAPIERVKNELTYKEWKNIIDIAWQAGIPHIVFTGGEPTLHDDLVQLIGYAQSKDQVTGLLTNGLRLIDNDYLNEILNAGLDHVMLILDPEIETAWSVLQNLCNQDIFTAVHLTIGNDNQLMLASILGRLSTIGVKAISLSSTSPNNNDRLNQGRTLIAEMNLDLIWNLPVPYSEFNPIAFETNHQEFLKGAGRAWLYIEPDGDVLPSQGINTVLGNILTDPWDVIWKKATSIKIAT